MSRADAVSAGVILVCGFVIALAGRALGAMSLTEGVLRVEALVGAVMSVVGVVAVLWWILTLLVAVAADLVLRRGPSTAARLAQQCTPAVMRRLAAALLGVNLVALPTVAEAAPSETHAALRTSAADDPVRSAYGAAAAPSPVLESGSLLAEQSPAATASPSWSRVQVIRDASAHLGTDTPAAGDAEERASVSPGWKPAPMPVGGSMIVRTPTRPALGGIDVVVAPGDSLWSIVEHHLGPLSTAADIAEAWPAWYDTNRAVIGDDPSLLLPGQVLRAPQA